MMVMMITNDISLLIIDLFRFSICSCISFGSLYLSYNLSLSSKLSNLVTYSFLFSPSLWHRIFLNSIPVLNFYS